METAHGKLRATGLPWQWTAAVLTPSHLRGQLQSGGTSRLGWHRDSCRICCVVRMASHNLFVRRMGGRKALVGHAHHGMVHVTDIALC